MPDNTKKISIYWWNVNRRLSEIVKNISPISAQKPDIIFVTETSAGYDAIHNIEGYFKFADQEIRELNYGGIACFISNVLATHVLTFHLIKALYHSN